MLLVYRTEYLILDQRRLTDASTRQGETSIVLLNYRNRNSIVQNLVSCESGELLRRDVNSAKYREHWSRNCPIAYIPNVAIKSPCG